jgi:general secretion pathway protein J
MRSDRLGQLLFGERRQDRRQGFTLMEIMIAMFILSVVISLVFGSLDGVFGSADHVNAQSDLLEMGHSCMERIASDLNALHIMSYPRYQPPGIDDDETEALYRIEGEAVSMGGHRFAKLRFASLAHLSLNHDAREGIAEIVYYIIESRDDGYTLRRKDTLYPYPEEFEEDENDPVVCERVQAFEVLYFDHEGRETEEWDSQSDDVEYATPVTIAIKLAVGEDEQAPMVVNTRVAMPVHRYKELKR